MRFASSFGFSLVLVTTGLVGCGGDDGGGTCRTASDCAAGQACVDGMCTTRPGRDAATEDAPGRDASGIDVGPPLELVSVRLEPETASLTGALGDTPTQDFELLGMFSDGVERPVSGPRFSLDSLAIGDIDEASGVFTANGVVGGEVVVRASADGPEGELSAMGLVEVSFTAEIVEEGVPDDPASLYDSPTDDPGLRQGVLYPLDRAVMPANVFPAHIQWGSTLEPAGVYRIRLTKPHFAATVYVPTRKDWLADADIWRALAESDPDEPATIQVDGWFESTGAAVLGEPVSMTFARAALTGSVYYWDIQRGRIVRIDDGTATPDEFMPNPPAAPRDGNRCVGCHAVSNSGRYMAGRLGGGDNGGAIFDLTTDLTADPAPTEYPISSNPADYWWFSSWSPDDSRMVVSRVGGAVRRLAFIDPFTGATITTTGAAAPDGTHPAWAPDGTQIAYAANINNWGGAFTAADIGVLNITGDELGASTVVHTGASLAGSSPAGVADSYPTWTPDSARIAFSHGSGTRSEDQQAALYIMNRDGTDVIRLDDANGAVTTNFQPRFSPFDQGGYFWLSFLSRRDYGNSTVGTAGTDLQQIWVTAIRKDAAPGEDPSSVPYWLPGQRTTSRNISAYWAPRPCREDGEGCSVGSECCGGDCRPGGDGELVCSPPPPDRCRMSGETCSTSADCCDDLECVGRVCLRPPG